MARSDPDKAAGKLPSKEEPISAADTKQNGTAEAAFVHVDCTNPRLDGKALYESLALELNAQGIKLRKLDAIKSDDNFILEVRTDCDTRQQLMLRAARGVRSVEEAFSLADVPRSSEPRTVALALAELLEDFGHRRSRQVEKEEAGAEPAPEGEFTAGDSGPSLDLGPEVDNAAFREPPIRILDAPVEPQEDPGVHLLVMVGLAQRTFKLSTSMVGVDAALLLERTELGASLLRGDQPEADDAQVSTVLGHLGLGYRVAEVTNGRWTASVIPRVGLGGLAVSSTDNEAQRDRAADVYADLAARVSVNALLWSTVGVTLNSEAGYGRGMLPIVSGPETHSYTGVFLGVALLASLDFSSRKADKLWPPVSAKEQ